MSDSTRQRLSKGIRDTLGAIANNATSDEVAASRMERMVWTQVLEAIESGEVDDPATLASLALSSQLINFDRHGRGRTDL
jgi:hypothetical protein